MQIPFLAWLLQGIPETIAMVMLIMVLCTGELPWKIIFKVALLQAMTAYLIRLLPFTPGVHTIVLITTMVMYLIWLAEIKFPLAAISSAITTIILIIFELLFYLVLSPAGVSGILELMENNIWIRIVCGYPQILFLVGLTWFLYQRKYNMANLFKRVSKDW